MTDKEYIAYLVDKMSRQEFPCDICEIGWRDEVCPYVDSTDRTACIEGMRKWAESKEKERKSHTTRYGR